MAEIKTIQNDNSVTSFLEGVPDEKRRQDSFVVLDLMKKVTGLEPKMWGDAIIGFGTQHYKYASGREGDTPLVGFSPRKQALTLYITTGFGDQGDLLERLGKYTTGKGCLYIKRISDIDLAVLEQIIDRSLKRTGQGTLGPFV